MCFENLPIEFDNSGNAHLIPGVPNPYEFKIKEDIDKLTKPKKVLESLANNIYLFSFASFLFYRI